MHSWQGQEKTNEQLRLSREEQEALHAYAQLYHYAPISYFTLDQNGAVLEANRAGAAFFGMESSTVTGLFLGSFFSGTSRQLFLDTLNRTFAGEEQASCEVELVPELAPRRFARVQTARFPSGIGCGVVVFEIAEPTETRESLPAHEERNGTAELRLGNFEGEVQNLGELFTERLELVLERMPIACVLLDSSFIVTCWNDAAQKVFGFSKEEALFRSPHETIFRTLHPESLETNRSLLRAGVTPASSTHEVMTKDGRLITCEWHCAPIQDQEGAVDGFISMVIDVTERVKSQEALTRSEQIQQQLNADLIRTLKSVEESLRARVASETALLHKEQELKKVNSELKGILDAVQERLILYARDLEILWSNREAHKYGDAKQTSTQDRAGAPPHAGGTPGYIRDCFDSGLQFADQVAKDPTHILDVTVYPIFDENGEVQSVLEVIRDVTRKTNEQAEAVRTAHLASLGELAAGVAHEINNPIHGIINYAEHLARKFPGEPRILDISHRIIKESERVAHIVRALLDFSRKRDGGKIRVRIEELLDQCLTLCKSQLRKDNIRVFTDQESRSLPEVWADPQQIVQVILNLISNARYSLNEKYPHLDNRKSLSFFLSTLTLDDRLWVKVAILDQGMGIPEHLRHKVLSPFFSTKANGGTGLGLSICNSIIADHGGRLEIASEEGAWTTVAFLLPTWRKGAP